jgi:hypothetical protein
VAYEAEILVVAPSLELGVAILEFSEGTTPVEVVLDVVEGSFDAP